MYINKQFPTPSTNPAWSAWARPCERKKLNQSSFITANNTTIRQALPDQFSLNIHQYVVMTIIWPDGWPRNYPPQRETFPIPTGTKSRGGRGQNKRRRPGRTHQGHPSRTMKLILSSRLKLLIVILKNIFAAFECDSQKHILIASCSVFTPNFCSFVM